VERINARIEVAGRHEAFHWRPEHCLMRLAQNGFSFRARLQHIALRMETIEGHLWRIIGEISVAARKIVDALPDFPRGIRRALARIDRDPAIESAPARHRRGPVASF